MYYLGIFESRMKQENANEVFPIVLVSLPRMSYITSKSTSVNYVRTVFRLRKSDQFTLGHASTVFKSYHIGVPRTTDSTYDHVWTSGTNGLVYVTDLKTRKTIYHKQIPFNNESIESIISNEKLFLKI